MSPLGLSIAPWRKSSYSSPTANCVEVAGWRKSSLSTNTANCVEVAAAGQVVAVRDSKNPDGPALVFACSSWGSFVNVVRSRALG
ncbi:DUF397 domain-containing protein [Streptoalloteichus hindustanus]|uniref:DUF397 domain-containing protein n=1 Tax=Streptoalloteichus hindustanus TaxID=2017 RepID=A0A1M5IV47_STRHI|nr:DUF397 domain-containing protein [Streptoalloteichus hindustanus]SHG32141.1 protein of unknown function [Streptoalloteichus hindustanus]